MLGPPTNHAWHGIESHKELEGILMIHRARTSGCGCAFSTQVATLRLRGRGVALAPKNATLTHTRTDCTADTPHQTFTLIIIRRYHFSLLIPPPHSQGVLSVCLYLDQIKLSHRWSHTCTDLCGVLRLYHSELYLIFNSPSCYHVVLEITHRHTFTSCMRPNLEKVQKSVTRR